MTVVFATGAMLLTYQLRSFKDDVEHQLQARLGTDLTIGAVSVNGLRGLQIDELKFTLPFAHGPTITMRIPTTILDLNLARLIQGELILDHVILNDAAIDILRPMDSVWYPPGGPTLQLNSGLTGSGTLDSFRIEGTNAQVTIRNVVNDTQIEIDRINFSVTRQNFSKEISAELTGNLFNDPRKQVKIKTNYESLDEFDVRIEHALLTSEDALAFFPSETPFVQSGNIHPTIRIYGGPDDIIILNLQAPFSNTMVANQPSFLEPATGDLSIFASYDTAAQELDITTAKVESEQIAGAIDGSIYFTEDFPLFDLQLISTHLPIQDMLDDILREQLEDSGTLVVDLDHEQQLTIRLQGTTDSPIIKSEIRSKGGTLHYTPNDQSIPPIDLTLGTITGTWDSVAEKATGSMDILDGTIIHEDSRLEAHAITGTLTLADDRIIMNPVNAEITGNAIVGSFLYDLETTDATIALNGTLQGIENTGYADAIKYINLGGALTFKCIGRKEGGEYFLDAQVEATQTQLDYMWWFAKPPGVGATGYINGHLTPGKGYHVTFDAEVASSQLSASLNAVYQSDRDAYTLATAELSSSYIDVPTIGSCVTLPYRISGTTGGYGFVRFERDLNNPTHTTQTFGGFIQDMELLPLDDNAGDALQFKNATIEVTLNNSDAFDGHVILNAATTNMPPFTSTWFVRPEPPEEYPKYDRSWTYTVSADEMALPPWIGHHFTGEGYSNPTHAGFHHFDLGIGDGSIRGSYHSIRAENSYTTDVQWEKIPAHFFLDHLNYDHILTGMIDGQIFYGVDRDDPGTLQGKGNFAIHNGQFSADFLYGILGGDDGGGLANLPNKLDFDILSSDVTLEKDTVLTEKLRLSSEGIKLDGKGSYVHDGDLDYTIKVALSPEMAESIPSLAQNLNIKGFKLAQRDIELGFNIVGPTFNPRRELAELPPASVTFVSGALQVTRDTISIIDTPRKILVDLLKLGGGIVGAGTTN